MAFSFNNDYTSPSPPSDEISIFLRQLLHRSSSSSPAVQPSSLPSTLDRSPYLNVALSSPSPAPLSNLRSSSEAPAESDSPTAGTFQLRSSDNDADDYDCESEDGPDLKRNSSKRSRAAEVHNLSEKRRRSRINEKMKALQNLIPNCNKTDKASMLDEAIEYLKQLQLQVQMLSMRNGLILHPMCLPGFPDVLDPDQLSQLGLNLSNRDGSSHPNTIGNTLPSLPRHQCDPLTRPCFDSLPGIISDEPPFSLESSLANHLGSFNLPTSSPDICREDTAALNQLAVTDSQTNVYCTESLYLRDDLQGVLQSNSTSHAQLVSSYLDGLCQGTTEFHTRVSSGILDRES